MVELYFVELCHSFYQRKLPTTFVFHDACDLMWVVPVFLEDLVKPKLRVYTLVFEDDEALATQEIARENSNAVYAEVKGANDITLEWIENNIIPLD